MGLILAPGLISFFLLSIQTSLAAPASQSLSKGMALAKQGKYQEAVTHLRQAEANASNFYYQAYCYYQLKHEQDAKKLFAYVVDKFPGTDEAKLALDFLKKLDPASIPETRPTHSAEAKKQNIQRSRTKAASSMAESSADKPEDFDKLPREARIFFTPGSSGHMVVDAKINGHPIKCWFDTGAPGLLFGKNNLRDLGIPVPQGDPTTSVRGWAGVSLPAWEMNLTVKVGNVERTLPAAIQEELDLPPLIGYSFIEGFQYEIDQKAKCMMLRKEQASEQALNALYDLPCKIVGTKPIVPLEVNGRRIPVFIDTGADTTIINASEAASFKIEVPSDAPSFTGGGIGGSTVYRGVDLNLKLGPIIRKDFQVLIGGHAGSCVGQDFLKGWRFTVDEQKGLLRFFH